MKPERSEGFERVLMLLWLLFFGGHWVGLTLLNWFGFVTLAQIAIWNDLLFVRCYLILFVLTLLALVLRWMRERGSKDDQSDRRSTL